MKVLFIGRYDWANASNRVARAINATQHAHEARVFTLEPHPFGYPEDMVHRRGNHHDLGAFAANADWIVSTGDGDYRAFGSILGGLGGRRGDCRLATAHVGSAFRDNHARFQIADDALGFDVRFLGGDLYRFAASDGRAVPYFVPPHDDPQSDSLSGRRLRVGHSPTNRAKKGTSEILSVLQTLPSDIEVDLIENTAFEECIRRRAACHVFVDQMNPEIGGFGASSVEALASGCVVLADVRHVVPEVNAFYPPPPIVHVVDAEMLRIRLLELLADPARLAAGRADSLRWARESAGQDAVARYWITHLEWACREPPSPGPSSAGAKLRHRE